jgi:orotate phosphoribosyltransferase
MEKYQKEFIEFAIERKALCFGEYKLKSGRISPYFFNTGLFNDGQSLAKLGRFYAEALQNSGIKFDMIYGPAYKGIPLASAMAISFHEVFGSNYPFCFNRKEIKDHAEGGITFGAEIRNRAIIIDDVISAGISIKESIDIIHSEGGMVTGAIVAVNRQEQGEGKKSAIQEAQEKYKIKIISIISLSDIISYISKNYNLKEHLEAINAYSKQYGEITS